MWRHVACGIVIGVILAIVTPWFVSELTHKSRGSNPVDRSIAHARAAIEACQIYRKLEDKYPDSFSELSEPKFNGNAILLEGYELDGWRRPLRYAVVLNDKGEEEPHVWTECRLNGNLSLVGAKGTLDGKVLNIGRPEVPWTVSED